MAMTCANLSLNLNCMMYSPITSTSQVSNVTSKLDMARIGGQTASPIARVPGVGSEHVIQVAPDFDDSLEFGI